MGLPGSNEDNFLIEDVDYDEPHDDNDTERSMEDSYNRYVALEESTTISIRSTPIDYPNPQEWNDSHAINDSEHSQDHGGYSTY